MKKYLKRLTITRDDVQNLDAHSLQSLCMLYVCALDRLNQSIDQPCDQIPLSDITLGKSVRDILEAKRYIKIDSNFIYLLKYDEDNITDSKLKKQREINLNNVLKYQAKKKKDK